jgi:hypothetical protein
MGNTWTIRCRWGVEDPYDYGINKCNLRIVLCIRESKLSRLKEESPKCTLSLYLLNLYKGM